ncbi:hypothetical protein QUA26_18710 [Microcoleus sp. Pol12A4]|uniref:hypothetical protein n=1 Tax=unclassified Microcoleus TaxID=2642155 RepID=UPI002FD2E34D
MGFTLQAGVETGQWQANCLGIPAFECDRTGSALANCYLSAIIQTTVASSHIPHFPRTFHWIDIRSQQQSCLHSKKPGFYTKSSLSAIDVNLETGFLTPPASRKDNS